MTKLRKIGISALSIVAAACLTTSTVAYAFTNNGKKSSAIAPSSVTRLDASVDTKKEEYFDSNSVYKLADGISPNDQISVIVSSNGKSMLDCFNAQSEYDEYSAYLQSREAKAQKKLCDEERSALYTALKSAKISYLGGIEYDTILNGFEITIQAKDYAKAAKALKNVATLMIGEVYEPAETQIVTNDVDVYETGIFDSSSFEHQGDGVVVAVLDTGLDYTHSAFDVSNFESSNLSFTLESVSNKVGTTEAAKYTAGLTGEDVYISKKVPYAYDYADKDADVFPIDSEHGTHVAGIIAGRDQTITGVAPNAQLAIMKVFSDTQSGAKTSWLLAALEDCVKLEVDVINMSLGSGCGFTTQDDEEKVQKQYDKVREAGISLITAAGNDYNAVNRSDKNGSNPLTSNPDSGVVGSPSTYEAALSVASVGGVKTPYIVYKEDSKDKIMYFTEASTSSAKTKNFVDDILKTLGDDVQRHDFEYVTIPGLGRRSDYTKEKSFYEGKIVLVKRGVTTFEEKVNIALKIMGAAGIIIYNNVSGTISMSVGADIGAVCSISQEEGEKLAAQESGILKIDRKQVAGPFMSDFSSWGPTSDLRIKPEITAHGGEILSAVPGQAYDRLSGTSMAAPNMAGAMALIRQYVKFSPDVFGNLTPQEVTARVNQLVMSTADIVKNKNGLPYAVRKQGAGLVNIAKATSSAAYISTYDANGNEMDKSKLELGDDKAKTGVYDMTFTVNNVTDAEISYDVNAQVMTEGVNTIYTSHGDKTVTQDGYLLSGAKTTVQSVSGGQQSGNVVIVPARGSAKVSLKIELSDDDKEYLDKNFENGMYVEGFVTLTAKTGTTVDVNVPYLAFYGDWTQAPIFDEEYYDTHADEINAGLDDEDKMMPDAYATRVIGGYYSDYISTLGTYAFVQNPASTQIAANKEHIALSNFEDGNGSALNSLYAINAGLLRNVKEWKLTITEDSTGLVIFEKSDRNQRKSFGNNGGTIYQSSMDVEFSVLENNLKNNTRYTVKVETFIDYGEKAEQKNLRNTFEFPLFIDFESPIVTDVKYRTEYDMTAKKTHLYADVSIYDNHYAMAVQFGQITPADPSSGYTFSMNSFGKYFTPVYSTFNSTSTVTVELTDYVSLIKQSAGIKYGEDGSAEIVYGNNSFIATCYDYAMNSATYELKLPDEILSMYFAEEEYRLSPNETLDLSKVLNIYPMDTWLQVLDFESSDSSVVGVVNQTLIAKKSGEAIITASGKDKDGNAVTKAIKIKVLAEGEEGYRKYDAPQVNKAVVAQYKVNKAYYATSSDEREIGITGVTYDFGNTLALSMYPSESVTLICNVDAYFPEYTTVKFSSGRADIASVTEDGTIVALKEGNATINVNAEVVYPGGKKVTFYMGGVDITVKDPYTTTGIYLTSYKGLGGEVVVPGDLGVTIIQSYAFSNYEFVEKDLSAGDVIDDEDPYHIKQTYIGEDTITKIVLPEGITTIEAYAFANLTALEEVVLPKSLTKIGVGAFLGCKKLKTINLENVKFINEKAFSDCALSKLDFSSIVAIGNYSFENNQIGSLELPVSSQSLGEGAFYRNTLLSSVTFKASKIKIGAGVFAGCERLRAVDINAAVIPSRAFYGCTKLETVNLGKDVSVIGEGAFGDTNVSRFTLSKGSALTLEGNGTLIYKGQGAQKELILIAPQCTSTKLTTDAVNIASGAFAGNKVIHEVYAPNAVSVAAYAFANCSNLQSVNMPKVREIGAYAFYNTELTQIDLTAVTEIGNFAFAFTSLNSVVVPNNTKIGSYAFAYCFKLDSVEIGDGVTIGESAFYCPVRSYTYEDTQNLAHYSEYTYEVKDEEGKTVKTYTYLRYNFEDGVTSVLTTLKIGNNVSIGKFAFADNARLKNVTLGDGADIGAYAFYNATALTKLDLSKALKIGEGAFSGMTESDYWLYKNYYRNAYEFAEIDGEIVAVGMRYSGFAPAFEEANLAAATELGVGAFAYNKALRRVTLGDKITFVPAFAFAACSSLSDITFAGTVSAIDAYAFMQTAVESIDLHTVGEFGANAFASTKLKEITLKENAVIGDGAFMRCESLSVVNNLDKAVYIGDTAFGLTALTSVNLANAEEIGSYAFALSAVKNVTFGDNKLVSLGENPFYGCEIASFAKTEKIIFNGQEVGERIVETYDVSDTVKVIDGVLYQYLPNGMELVSYPSEKVLDNFTVVEGTVRISSRAFMNAKLVNVTLPSSLKSLGDKAFYRCEKLKSVTFRSYEAPMLEEEYDEYYLDYTNLPISGFMGGYEGLGISNFYMWNVASNRNNFYFGANFVDYVGKAKGDLVMVCPANGKGYQTFIFSQYFNTFIEGSNALMDETKAVIAVIAALPENITLADEAAVVEARRLYDALSSLEQKSLVSNYSTLTKAENMIDYLKPKPDDGGDDPDDPDDKKGCGSSVSGALTAFVALTLTAFVCGEIVFGKKRNHNGN